MKNIFRFIASTFLIFAFIADALPCGPSYVTPLFDYKSAPENPYMNFASGRIGILKPTYHRSVLFAAYRYFNGGSFNAAEQKALIDVWNAEFNNRNYNSDDVGEALKLWIAERKTVVGKEEKTPDIYAERDYGGYDFFPNCARNAFETATQVLKDRKASYGTEDRDVKEWVAGQDKVFENCSSGRQMPVEADASMAEWLQKDRAYQTAAAHFYSLDYEDAKRRFADIAQDFQSPWRETAEYLIGRTLIRQASLGKDEVKSNLFYTEAEDKLYRIAAGGGKFADSAENLLGLIKFRLHPEQRVRELAQTLSYQGGGENFRQQLIDYTWLLDKFEKESLEAEAKRKEESNPKTDDTNSEANAPDSSVSSNTAVVSNSISVSPTPKSESDLTIYFSKEDYSQSWTMYVDENATDEEAFAEAERIAGTPLTERMQAQVREGRKAAYSNRFSNRRENDYPGRYYGEEETTLSILPREIRSDDLTDWLYTYQLTDAESYLYSLNRYKQTASDLWLATAISKAQTSSTELNRLFEAAAKVRRDSTAFPTVAYHQARLLIELKKPSEARKLLDDVLSSGLDAPISTINQFLDLRVKLSETVEDFLRYSQKKPFAFSFDGEGKTIDEIIEENKTWYNPEYDKQTKEEYDAEIEKNYAEERLWQDRLMLDDASILTINQNFPVELILQSSKSSVLPEYQQKRFLMAAFVRLLLLENYAAALRLAPEVSKTAPSLESYIGELAAARPNARKYAALYMILKNEDLSPFVPSGFGKSWEQPAYASRWWCELYDEYYDENTQQSLPYSSLPKPSFITAAQRIAAQNELKKLKEVGDAPKYLARSVLEWAHLNPRDKRVPESLFLAYEANDWDKYGCGGNQELRKEAGNFLKTKYPSSEWTRKLDTEEEQ